MPFHRLFYAEYKLQPTTDAIVSTFCLLLATYIELLLQIRSTMEVLGVFLNIAY